MPLLIVRNDITKMEVDAIVNAANNSLLGGGGVDGAIHRAAGPELLAECRTLGGCETGQAKITKGYDLPAKYVIHTVGPVWNNGRSGEAELLTFCYENSLRIAAENGCETVAFPLISAGIYGYPQEEALEIAVSTIRRFLFSREEELTVYIVLLHRAEFLLKSERFADICRRIDYMDNMERMMNVSTSNVLAEKRKSFSSLLPGRKRKQSTELFGAMDLEAAAPAAEAASTLEHALEQIDESFTEMLLRKIDERGMTDAQCYKKANIDRKLFSKIRSDMHYRPKKVTVIAFALALELSLDETKDMLMKAGFALSHSSKFDIIVEYFISHGKYNVFEINELLYAYDQVLIGA